MFKMKNVVLLHGYNPNEPNWERVVWGEAPNLPGRIPTAVAAALENRKNRTEIILFHATDDSGPMMRDLLVERFEDLKKFTCFEVFRQLSIEEMREHLQINVVDLQNFGLPRPKNTWEEMLALKQVMHSPWSVVAVSSMDHTPRVYRDFCRAFKDEPEVLAHFSVRGALSLYGPKTSAEESVWGMGQLVILEIPGVKANFSLIREKKWTPDPLPDQ
jgi:5S rRNA maturation endonuclease (ribonuclease M5)